MITDKNKNITSITYNHLNLPVKITFATTGNIEYIYNANGVKLSKTVNKGTCITTITDYLGGFQYESMANKCKRPGSGYNGVLKFFATAEGYVEPSAGSYKYVYQYKDHLGNIRLSYAKNPATQVLTIIDENNYYPFGLKHKGYNDYVATSNKYKYNGKELQDELSLNLYDYGARNYDPALGRWMNIDPLAEVSRRFSPYTYALNNPVYFIDPDGMKAEAGQSGNYYDWDEKQYKNKDTGKTVDADVAIASHMDDNGYDEKGNQVNNKGGDTTEYLYGKDGKIISSTSVKLKNISQGEFGSNGGKLRGYGFKGWKMATGNSESMEFSSPIFPMSAVLKPFLGALLGTTKIVGTSVFRAVDATERGIINSTGKFSLEAGVLESKYFAQSLQDAHWYGKGLYPNGYSIIEATVKSPVDASQYWFPHIDIGAFVFPAETLPYIIPK